MAGLFCVRCSPCSAAHGSRRRSVTAPSPFLFVCLPLRFRLCGNRHSHLQRVDRPQKSMPAFPLYCRTHRVWTVRPPPWMRQPRPSCGGYFPLWRRLWLQRVFIGTQAARLSSNCPVTRLAVPPFPPDPRWGVCLVGSALFAILPSRLFTPLEICILQALRSPATGSVWCSLSPACLSAFRS